MNNKCIRALALVGGILVAAPGWATTETTTETWNFNQSVGPYGSISGDAAATPVAPISTCSATPSSGTGSVACDLTVMGSVTNTGNGTPLAANNINAYALSTQTLNALNATYPTKVVSGNWIQAQIAVYGSNGIGITNVKQTTLLDTTVPQHAIDNSEIQDVLVLDLGSAGWDTVSFNLGYICAINSAGTGCPAAGAANPFTIQAWMGGSSLGAGYDFTKMCFTGCVDTTKNLLPTPDGNGFTEVSGQLTSATDTVTYTSGPSGSTVANFSGTATSLTITAPATGPLGEYLIITPGLNDSVSAFKVSQLVATKTVTTTTTGAPIPGSAWLLALGLLALTRSQKRRAAVARIA